MSAPASLEELLDHHAIVQVLYRYASSIDTLDYDGLDDVFAEDGVVDYGAFDGPRGEWSVVKPWATESLARFPLRKHYVTNPVIELEDGRARATCVSYWRSPMGMAPSDGEAPTFFESGGRYLDVLEKGDAGWRIRERVVEAQWVIGDVPPP